MGKGVGGVGEMKMQKEIFSSIFFSYFVLGSNSVGGWSIKVNRKSSVLHNSVTR